MRLRKPCQHGRYDSHSYGGIIQQPCPGGEFLADDALVPMFWCVVHEKKRTSRDDFCWFEHRAKGFHKSWSLDVATRQQNCKIVEASLILDALNHKIPWSPDHPPYDEMGQ